MPVNIRPGIFRNVIGNVGRNSNVSSGPSKEIPEIDLINELAALLDLDSEHKGKEQLVAFKERAAHVLVQTVGEIIIEVREALFVHVGRRGVFDAHHKQVRKPLQRVLVHGVDRAEVHDAEEEQTRSERDGPVGLSGLVDLRLSDFRVLDSLVDFAGELLRRRKFIDECFVFEHRLDIASLRERLEDGVFDVEKLLLVLRVLFYDFRFLEFQVGVLERDDLREHLFLEPARRDREVDDRHLHERFRGVVRVRVCRRHE